MSRAQYNLKTKNAKFLTLVADNAIEPALKTYCDTVLFYYLGCLATSNTSGDIIEIGVGGSTYPLIELAEINDKIFFVVDSNVTNANNYTNLKFWPKAKIEKYIIDSKHLNSSHITNQLSYCHIDGDKNFENTISDIEFCLNNLSSNGLICQDDYGNHKWPTVTDAVKDLEFQGKIKLILVGDSSVWFTKPEYYEFWISMLDNDYEYSLLSTVCNISKSDKLGKTPSYFWMNSLVNFSRKDNYAQSELDYFEELVQLDTSKYLQMPYRKQSKFGIFLSRDVNKFYLTKIYMEIKGPDWPDYTPGTRQEIEQLPEWIKTEIKTMFKIDPYQIDIG